MSRSNECPKCGAEPGEWCVSPNTGAELDHAHSERWDLHHRYGYKVLAVPCASCGALKGYRCQSVNGRPTRAHKGRRVLSTRAGAVDDFGPEAA